MLRILSRAGSMAALAVVCAFAAMAQAADPLPMLVRVPAAGPTAMLPPAEAAVSRQRPVVVEFGFLEPGSPTAASVLGLELFDGRIVTLDRTRVEARGPGNFTWYGRVRGYEQGDVVLTVVGGHIAGTIEVVDTGIRASTTFQLRSIREGTVLRQLDPGGFPPEHPPGAEGRVTPRPLSGFGGVGPGETVSDITAGADAGDFVDVMVVYTNQTALAAGGAIAAQIQQAVDRANLAYANSNVVPRLRLARYAQVNYDETGLDFNQLLDRLTSTGDGHMDEVHTWRDTYGADLVSLFVENGAYCGLGWLNSNAASAFTVVNRGCAGGNLSFAHELGHNFGAHHDPYVATNSTYPYGHGYTYVPGLWRTVMAYNNACSAAGVNCTRVAHFSNPDIDYGTPATPTGTVATHDNARVHDERALTVANFRQAVTVTILPPTVTTTAASGITATAAIFNGTVSSNGASTTVTFQYGLTAGYGSVVQAAQSPLADTATGAAVSGAISGLACNTLYHFRAVGANSAATTNGADQSFTTAACPPSPPAVTTQAATSITVTGATLNGVASSNGATTTVTFQYGLTTGFGNVAMAVQSPLAAGIAGAAVSATIGGLACNTAYHFRAVGTNSAATTHGANLTFATAACAGTSATTTTLSSNANPSSAGTLVTLKASVTGIAPTGNVAFLDGGTPVGGCAAVALAGSGDTRSASCTTGTLSAGAHVIAASYNGDAVNAASASAPLVQQVVAALPVTATVVVNPYGAMTIQGGTLVGNLITLTSPNAVIQLGGGAAVPGGSAQFDFQGLHVAPGSTLTVRSGAPGQAAILRNVTTMASAIGGTLQAQGGNGAPPPELYLSNPKGFAIAPSGNVNAPSGLSLDALGATWTVGANVVVEGTLDGGASLDLFGASIRGSGAFRGNAIRLRIFGNANNPVNGAYFLQNGLQLHPSTGSTIALTLNAYGGTKQIINLFAHGNATAWMPSTWPAGVTAPLNNAVIMPGGARPAGVPEPGYGGGSMIVQATGSLALVDGGTNDFVFPGAIVFKALGTLDLNGVVVDQGWTTTGQSFQGVFLESPSIVNPGGNIHVYGNDLNWINFSTLPQANVRAFSLKRNADGSASFAAADTTAPHLNTYSVLQNAAAAGACWTCLVNTQPIPVFGP